MAGEGKGVRGERAEGNEEPEGNRSSRPRTVHRSYSSRIKMINFNHFSFIMAH